MAREKVAVLFYPGCISFEVNLALELLARKFEVISYSPDGGATPTSQGLTVNTSPVSAGPPSGCRAVLVPGGEFSSLTERDDVSSFLRTASDQGAVLAAICGGVFALGRAGLLHGRKYVHPFDEKQMAFLANYFTGAEAVAKEYLHDGNLLTAQPFAFGDFAVELAHRLGVIKAEEIIKYKNYYRGFPHGRIRPIALGVIRRPSGQMLLHEGFDRVTGAKFYRPLGGGVEFGEPASVALAREIQEELHLEVKVGETLDTVENLFRYEGRQGHEYVILLEARFARAEDYQTDRFPIDEGGIQAGWAVWRSPEEIQREGSPLYPEVLFRILK